MSIVPPPTSVPPSPARAIDYQSAPPDPAAVGPSEFDVELQSERTRWIRRRFLWLCAVNVLIVVGFFVGFSQDIHAAPPLARVFNVLDVTLITGGYAAAFVYVWRARPALAGLLRFGVYVTAILPSLSIVFTRIDVTLNAGSYDFMGGSIGPGATWAMMSPWSLLVSFTIACLFVPWTVREALWPGAFMLAANALVLAGDLAFTIRQPFDRTIALANLAVSPGAILPGLLICWWRFSRFRKRYQLVFESSGYRKLQNELAGARRLHESCLPSHALYTTGPVRLAYAYEPMRQIGGDVLYVHPPDRPDAPRLSVVLIDVNGHGIAAALMANRLIGETQRLFAENPDACPHEILCALNRYVRLTMSRDGVYATALVLRLDATADTLEYANGGHPPALLRRGDNGAIARLDSNTYLLGVHDGDDYCPDCERVAFGRGDAVLGFTDGATEARDPAGEMLTIPGLERLLGQLAAAQTPDRWPPSLLNLIVNHRRAPAADDTLLVALHRA